MDYHSRLIEETEIKDLHKAKSPEYIELRIKDQSVYWGDNQLLNANEKLLFNQNAYNISMLYNQHINQSPNLTTIKEIENICRTNHAGRILTNLSASNYNQAKTRKFAKLNEDETRKQAKVSLKLKKKQQFLRNNQNNPSNNNNNNKKYKTRDLIIFAEKREERIKYETLQTIENFAKPMILLITHYWACFPANKSQWRKAELIIKQLERYQQSLKQFKQSLQLQSKSQLKNNQNMKSNRGTMILNLEKMLNKVFDHFKLKNNELQTRHVRLVQQKR